MLDGTRERPGTPGTGASGAPAGPPPRGSVARGLGLSIPPAPLPRARGLRPVRRAVVERPGWARCHPRPSLPLRGFGALPLLRGESPRDRGQALAPRAHAWLRRRPKPAAGYEQSQALAGLRPGAYLHIGLLGSLRPRHAEARWVKGGGEGR